MLTDIGESTAVNRLTFRLTYEFITLAQDGVAARSGQATLPIEEARPDQWARPGEVAQSNQLARPDQAAWAGGDQTRPGEMDQIGGVLAYTSSCDRVFRSKKAGGPFKSGLPPHPFGSPANVFLYGRGGRTNLTCSYLFLGAAGQRVSLTIQNVSLGTSSGAFCRTVHDPELGRYRCDFYDRSQHTMHTVAKDGGRRGVYVSEVAGEPLSRSQCFCQYLPGASVWSTGSAIKVTFLVPNMDEMEDNDSVFFRGSFQFLDEGAEGGRCQGRGVSAVIADSRPGGGGHVTLNSCDGETAAWARRASAVPGRQLLLRLGGLQLPQPYIGSPPCPLKSRLIVTTAGATSVICPLSGQAASSSDPLQITAPHPLSPYSNITYPNHGTILWDEQLLQTILVQLVGPSSSTPVRLSWLEYSPDDPSTLPPSALSAEPLSAVVLPGDTVCPTACPGLGCIGPALWCDGVPDCPDGADESPAACSNAHLFSLRLLLLGLAVGGATVFCLLVVLLAARLRMRLQHQRADRRLKLHEEEQSVLKRTSNGTVETMLNHKVFPCIN